MTRLAEPTTEEQTGTQESRSGNVMALRQKLHQKAKDDPSFRFYSLYGHISRTDVLSAAWQRVWANKGAPGIDGISLDQIVTDGVSAFLAALQRDLRAKTYRADPVRRVYLTKADGSQRPLGIPTVRDRVVQMATVLVIEPIFEADFLDCSYGFRPGRSAHQALGQLQSYLKAGYRAVYDADLAGYFDSIPHDRLLRSLEQRISDQTVLRLIQQWLEAPVVEPGQGGASARRDSGTPQGGVISPLLSNVYLHWFDVVFHGRDGPAEWAKAKLIRYADDFVIVARWISPRLEHWVEATVEQWMGLRLNQQKTQVLDVAREGLDFLGYTFRYEWDRFGGGYRYLTLVPSKQAERALRARLKALTSARLCAKPIAEVVASMNVSLRGWATYFRVGHAGRAYAKANGYARDRLFRHLCRRSQRGWRIPQDRSFGSYARELGLLTLRVGCSR